MRHTDKDKVAPSAEDFSDADARASSFKGRLTRNNRHDVFAALSRQAVTSPLFCVSRDAICGDVEREPLGSDLNDQLYDFARRAAFSLNAPDQDYWDAHTAMTKTLELLAGEFIAEALSFHGITDAPTVCETIRCVVKGGRMFDGDGFTKDASAESTDKPSAQGMSREEADAFVKQWLPDVEWLTVGGWVVAELRDGNLWPCPSCHSVNVRGGDCAVCTKRPEAISGMWTMQLEGGMFEDAERLLVGNRCRRAEYLHELNLNDFDAADNLNFAAMYGSVSDVWREGKACEEQRSQRSKAAREEERQGVSHETV